MITQAVCCPHCQKPDSVVKAGYTDCGSPRARCNACQKCFAIAPRSRAVTAEKEAAILRLLEERITIRGICRAVKCGPQTVYATLKKSRGTAGL